MNSESNAISELGTTRVCKPSTAINLSLFLPGLGQIYCGAFRRGLLHVCIVSVLWAVGTILIATRTASPVAMLVLILALLAGVMIYSAWDARHLALSCREDYRLKDYNRVSVYCAITLLVSMLGAGMAFAVRDHFLQPFKMVTSSMSPTLNDGDRFFVRKGAYRYRDPSRHDLVAFMNPTNRKQTWVKRVLGLPGETFELKNGEVFINGEALAEAEGIRLDQANFGPVTIPEHHCYVLGDNREKSRDSRHIGPVPMIALVGKVVSN